MTKIAAAPHQWHARIQFSKKRRVQPRCDRNSCHLIPGRLSPRGIGWFAPMGRRRPRFPNHAMRLSDVPVSTICQRLLCLCVHVRCGDRVLGLARLGEVAPRSHKGLARNEEGRPVSRPSRDSLRRVVVRPVRAMKGTAEATKAGRDGAIRIRAFAVRWRLLLPLKWRERAIASTDSFPYRTFRSRRRLRCYILRNEDRP